MEIVIIIEEVNETFSVCRDQAESIIPLGIAEVAFSGAKHLPDLGVLVQVGSIRSTLVDALVVVYYNPLLQQGESNALSHLVQ